MKALGYVLLAVLIVLLLPIAASSTIELAEYFLPTPTPEPVDTAECQEVWFGFESTSFRPRSSTLDVPYSLTEIAELPAILTLIPDFDEQESEWQGRAVSDILNTIQVPDSVGEAIASCISEGWRGYRVSYPLPRGGE